MDWRSFSGRALVEGGIRATKVGALIALGNDVKSSVGLHEIERGLQRVMEDDVIRGWAIAVCWIIGSMIELSRPK